jgi:serine/threonine protein phosphatase PrpC
MRWEQTVEYAALSDIGLRRQNNEDSFAVLVAPRAESYLKFGHVFLVADGMGGHAVGELASKMAADMVPLAFQKLRDQPYPDALKQAIEETNTAIHTRGERNTDFRKMGTTCSTLVLSPEGALVGHVGDSRCYRVRANRIDQLTFDHSLQWELIRQGRQKREEILLTQPRNIITRCLGPQPEVDVDIEGPYSISHDDAYVLCSDGLTGLVQDAEIGIIVKYLPPVDACRLLVDLANLRGGGDNITVIVARVGALPEGLSEQSIPLMPSAPDAISWGWFAAWCGWSLMVAIGSVLLLSSKAVEGWLTLCGALIILGVLIILGLRHKRVNKSWDDLEHTVIFKPHRSSEIKLNADFLGHLTGLEQTLQTTATEEGWTIDWAEHKKFYDEATNSLAARDFKAGLLHLGRALHVLMVSLQEERRRKDHVAKWGDKLPLPPAKPKAGGEERRGA